jgi:hypothetical protein
MPPAFASFGGAANGTIALRQKFPIHLVAAVLDASSLEHTNETMPPSVAKPKKSAGRAKPAQKSEVRTLKRKREHEDLEKLRKAIDELVRPPDYPCN